MVEILSQVRHPTRRRDFQVELLRMIKIKSLCVGSRLLPMSFQCERGEVVHVVGPNGSGKSTLLSAIAGVLDYQGQALVDGVDVKNVTLKELALKRAYLSQSERPAFNIEVFQYLALSVPEHTCATQETIGEVIAHLTQLVDIRDKLHRSINQLSGGEWQRVRLAAICLQVWPSLNPNAKALFLDEPAAPLDIGQEALLYQLIREVAQQGICVVMANHDLNRTLRLADKAILLDKGVLQSVGTAKEVLNPQRLSDVFKTRVKMLDLEGQPYLIFD